MPRESRLDQAMGEFAAAVDEILPILAATNDEATARTARTKLQAIRLRMARSAKTVAELQGKGAQPADAAKFQANQNRAAMAVQRLVPESIRLMSLPGTQELADELLSTLTEAAKLPGVNVPNLGIGLPGFTPPAAAPPAAPAREKLAQRSHEGDTSWGRSEGPVCGLATPLVPQGVPPRRTGGNGLS